MVFVFKSDPVHYGSILWHDVGKNPILVGYVVLGIGYGVSAHDLSGYKDTGQGGKLILEAYWW